MRTDTIAAIATAMTNAGIGIVRVSGSEAFTVIDKLYRPKSGTRRLSQAKSHTVHYGYIYDGDTCVDEVLVILMRGPHSYTAEDTVEIDCHGGSLVTRRILETVIKNGARPAEPGEFTKRAFLNGRIDLTQAESVMDVIQAENEFALESSVSQLKGALKDRIEALRGRILHEIALIESALDDPEHVSLEGYGAQLLQILEEACGEVDQLLKNSEEGALLKEGIHTVIVGKPNAGKSSLLNRLVGRERAIVTEIAGTTRDALEEEINLGGLTLHVVDTAGIRRTEDVVEKIGVDKAREYLTRADLIIYVVDSSRPLDENDEEILWLIQNRRAIILWNKSDLEPVLQMEDFKEKISGEASFRILPVSAKEGSGIAELEEVIREMFFQGEISYNNEVYVTNVRQKAALKEALRSLTMVRESIEAGMPEDFYSIDLMDAYEALGRIIGESVGEDLVNEIFARFCVGK